MHEHHAACEDCQRIYVEIQDFYSEALSVKPDAHRPETTRLLERIRANSKSDTNIIELYPHARSAQIQAERPALVALAALDTEETPRYSTLKTLSTADSNVLIRVIRDNKKRQDLFQVHAESPKEYAHVLVTFQSIGKPVITDADGEATIGTLTKSQLDDLHAYVVSAISEFRVTEVELSKLQTERHVELEVHNTKLQLHLGESAIFGTYSDTTMSTTNTSHDVVFITENDTYWALQSERGYELPLEALGMEGYILVY